MFPSRGAGRLILAQQLLVGSIDFTSLVLLDAVK
jgi:hypothetical protein